MSAVVFPNDNECLRYDILSLGDPCAQLTTTAARALVFYHQRLDPVQSVPGFFGFNLVAGKTDTNA